jgi:hypothetical protein
MGEVCGTYGRSSYGVLVRRPEGKRPLERPADRWDNIKMDVQEIGWGSTDWTDLAHHRDRWQALVNGVMNLQFP